MTSFPRQCVGCLCTAQVVAHTRTIHCIGGRGSDLEREFGALSSVEPHGAFQRILTTVISVIMGTPCHRLLFLFAVVCVSLSVRLSCHDVHTLTGALTGNASLLFACASPDHVQATAFTECDRSCGGGVRLRMLKVNNRQVLQRRSCNVQKCPSKRNAPSVHQFSVARSPGHSKESPTTNFHCSFTRHLTSHSMENVTFHSLLS